MRKVKIALGRSAKSNRITHKEVSVRALFNEFRKPIIRAEKDGRYFIFAEFRENKRNARALLKYHGATIDLDNTDLTIPQIRRRLRGYIYAIYTTHSHMAPGKGNRFRVVIPYTKAVDPAPHKATVRKLMRDLGIDGAPESKTLALPMYLPAVPKRREKHFRSVVRLDGKLYEPQKPSDNDIFDDAAEVEPFDVNTEVAEGERNIAITRMAGKSIKNGMDLETATLSAIAYNEVHLKPPLPEDEVRSAVASIFNSHKRNTGDVGWGFDEIIRRIEVTSDIHKDYKDLLRIIALDKQLTRSEREIAIKKIKTRTGLTLASINDEIAEIKAVNRVHDDTEDENDTQLSLKELKEEFENWVYIAGDDRWYDMDTSVDLKPNAFNNKFRNLCTDVTISSLLLQYKAVKIVDRTMFNPQEGRVFDEEGIDYVNTYIPVKLRPRAGSVKPLERHFRYLLEEDIQIETMLDYIAFLVQYPGEKILWMPIVKGMKRIGKSMIADYVVRPVLGMHNVMPVDTKQIGGDFNSWQTGKQLIVFHELRAGEARSKRQYVTDTLKSFITDPWIMMHRKGLDPYQVRNLTNVMSFTNYEDAVMITQDEQRFCMMRSDAVPRNRRYYERFIDWTKANPRQMLKFFKERDLQHFNNTTAPATDYTQLVKAASRSWPLNILQEEIDRGPDNSWFNSKGLFYWSELIEFIRERSDGEDLFKLDNIMDDMSSRNHQVANPLQEAGFRKWQDVKKGQQRIYHGGKQESIWVSPFRTKEFAKTTRAAAKRELRKK